jgi:regulator of sigma E protease
MADILSNPVVAAIVLLGFLIFFHELGHYWVGRLCGIAVESFSIGFGPQIVAFERGRTMYRIGLLPLGGYVKFYGMTPTEEVPEDLDVKQCFYRADLWKRFMTVAAGPAFNILLAFIIYVILGTAGLPYANTVIGHIEKDSPAAEVGLMPLDEILAINGKEIKKWQPMRDIILNSPGKALSLKVKRDDQFFEVQLTPEVRELENIRGEKVQQGRAGIARGRIPAVLYVQSDLGFKNLDRVEEIQTLTQVVKVNDWYTFEKSLRTFLSDQSQRPIKVKLNREDQSLWITLDESITSYEQLGLNHAQLVYIEPTDPSFVPALQKGDQIISWNGVKVESIYDLYAQMSKSMEQPQALVLVERSPGEMIELTLDLRGSIEQFAEGAKEIFSFPVRFAADMVEPEFALESYVFFPSAFVFAAKETAYQTGFLVRALKDLLSGQLPLKTLGGPVLIAKVAGDSAKAGWKMFLITMALISVNLAVVNMFPIPVLDGGQLVMFSIEALRRKPMSMKAVENYQKIGFVMILCLIVLATYNDLSRFWTSILRSLNG